MIQGHSPRISDPFFLHIFVDICVHKYYYPIKGGDYMSRYFVKFICPDNEIVTFKGLGKRDVDALVSDWLGSYIDFKIEKEEK